MDESNRVAFESRNWHLGEKFVVYQYCISVLIMTFNRSSNIYFVPGSESRVLKGLGFSLLSSFWAVGNPVGPIYTIQSLWVNFNGGKDVTQEVLASMARRQTSMIFSKITLYSLNMPLVSHF